MSIRFFALFSALVLVLSGTVLLVDYHKNGSNTYGDGILLSLRILHINDHHSHLTADGASLEFNGQDTDVEMGGFPRVVAKIKERAAAHANVLKLHAGDAITGDLYYTLFKGQADAALMNQVCFDAFSLGNHEFDDGDAGLKQFLDYLNAGGCGTQVLAANVEPEVGVSPLTPSSSTDYLQPYIIEEFGSAKVGIIGIDIVGKTKNSSSPDPTTQFHDETETAQKYIDELRGQGVDKIILMTHYQYQNDQVTAKNLRGVDVIIGGDSHTLLGESLANFGLNPQGPYPTMTNDRDGNPVCIAHAWQYALAVGELNVEFDADGNVTSCAGTPHILLGDTFQRDDAELAGAAREEVLHLIASTPELSVVPPDATAEAVLNGYAAQVGVMKNTVIGQAADDLCMERIPGRGLSQICDVSATSARGSDISNLVALAFKTQSLRADLSIQNGGGVRIDIPAGEITIGDVYTLLPFANTLVNLDITGAEIVAVLEDALDYALSPDGSTGAYPYASGLRWTVDTSKPKGRRFSNVQVKLKGETEWSPIDPARTYVVVTHSYIASGKDGYLSFKPIFENPSRVEDTFLDYAQSFVDYVKVVGTVTKLPASEYSTQRFYDKE